MGKKIYEKGRIAHTVKISQMSDKTIRDNILSVLKQSTVAEIDGGKVAYSDYNRVMRDVAHRYLVSSSRVTGVFCALSPNSDWMGNLRSMITLVKGYREGWPEEDVTVTTYNSNRAKAWRLVQGEPFCEVYKGLKVNNFYRSIRSPQSPDHVTVDGHMANVARNQQNGMWYSGLNDSEYRRVKDCFQLVAYRNNILPSQLQGILWFTWKRIHAIKAPSTVEMFDREFNAMRPYLDTSVIKPFPRKSKPLPEVEDLQLNLFD